MSHTTIVPRLWPGQIVVVAGAGPSLTQSDLDYVRAWQAAHPDRLKLLVINDAYQLAPQADVIYAADGQWWEWHKDIPDDHLPLLKYAAQPTAVEWRPSVIVLNVVRGTGLSVDRSKLVSGGHGGHQAIGLAVHLGASQIVLLGFDWGPDATGRHHFHAEHPNRHHVNYAEKTASFGPLVRALEEREIAIINCSRTTALPAALIPRRPITDVLA